MIGLLPIFFSLISGDKLLGSHTPRAAFIDAFMGNLFFLLFTFGCLILTLPLSADEITDHILDLYIVRPISRETIWFTRWIVANISVVLVNTFIGLCYYIYFYAIDPNGFSLSALTTNSDLMWNMILFLIASSITYTGIFLLIGFLGKNALAIGVFVAIFEVFLSALVFLKDQPYLPRTNLQVVAVNLFKPDYTYTFAVTPPDLSISVLYILVIAFVFLAAGAYFVKTRELV